MINCFVYFIWHKTELDDGGKVEGGEGLVAYSSLCEVDCPFVCFYKIHVFQVPLLSSLGKKNINEKNINEKNINEKNRIKMKRIKYQEHGQQ
jgi:hypothetical protein